LSQGSPRRPLTPQRGRPCSPYSAHFGLACTGALWLFSPVDV